MATGVGRVERRAGPIGLPRFRPVTAALLVALLLLAGAVGYGAAGLFGVNAGQGVSADVMRAWATGETADIEAIYAEDVVMTLDGERLAASRDEITSVIRGAIAIGNTYTQVGEVTAYEHSSGDLYVGTLVEVVGPGHPSGVPVVGFYRVHEGKVDRHVFMDAEHY